MPQTKLILFKEDDGSVSTLRWLEGIPSKAAAKCLVKLERLRELGHELRRPEADFLRDRIYELRVGLQGVNYRLLYFFHEDIAAVVSHGLTKESAVPPKEIDKAIERRRRFERNPKKHTYEDEV